MQRVEFQSPLPVECGEPGAREGDGPLVGGRWRAVVADDHAPAARHGDGLQGEVVVDGGAVGAVGHNVDEVQLAAGEGELGEWGGLVGRVGVRVQGLGGEVHQALAVLRVGQGVNAADVQGVGGVAGLGGRVFGVFCAGVLLAQV